MIFCYCVEAILILWILIDLYRMKTCKDLAKINILLMIISAIGFILYFLGCQKGIVDWIRASLWFLGNLFVYTTHFLNDALYC